MSLTAQQLIEELSELDPETILGVLNDEDGDTFHPFDSLGSDIPNWDEEGRSVCIIYRQGPRAYLDEPPAPKFQVGDRVVVTEKPKYLDGRFVGILATIERTKIDPRGHWEWRVESDDPLLNGHGFYVHSKGIRHATPGEIAADERRQALAKFKVGDRVRMNSRSPYTVKYGEVGTVAKVNPNKTFCAVVVEFTDGSVWNCQVDEVELLPAEITVTLDAAALDEVVDFLLGDDSKSYDGASLEAAGEAIRKAMEAAR